MIRIVKDKADLKKILAKADAGDQRAQVGIGNAYILGLGVKQSTKKGIQILEKYARQGNPDAMFWLSLVLGEGYKPFLPNPEAEVLWLTEAAECEHPDACTALGEMYLKGSSVLRKNLKKAVRLFETAAKNGSQEAQYHLGQMYRKGQGLSKDLNKAKKWLLKSAQQGNEAAVICYGDVLRMLNKHDQARKWFLKYAKQGNSCAMRSLGEILIEDVNQPNSIVQGLALLQAYWKHWETTFENQQRKIEKRFLPHLSQLQLQRIQRKSNDWFKKIK